MKKDLQHIAERYGLSMIILFGSMATKKLHARSDVDLAVISRRKLSMDKELRLRHDFALSFKREADVVFLERASPLLLGQIARDGKLLFGSKKDFTALRIKAKKMYIDFKPYFDLRAQTVRKILRTQYA